jgi:feruloyl esterase
VTVRLAIGVVPGRRLGAFSDGFIRSFVTRDPSFDTRTWDANNWLASLSLVGALYQAFDPNFLR